MIAIGQAGRLLRFAGAVLVSGHLAACANQPREDVHVAIGSGPQYVERAKDYASLYLPYAMMATAAYANAAVLDGRKCPDSVRLNDPSLARDRGEVEFHQTVRSWIAYLNQRNWECHFGQFGSLPCPPGPTECRPVEGLEFHVWRRMNKGCREAVIAFRGTDRNDLGDWRSNLRWLYRLSPTFDQYDQVRYHMADIVGRIERGGCNRPDVMFASTGHSLGGGLAQQAAYAHPRFNYVYAFDPSPVTGFFDLSAVLREENTKDLGVDRAYEAGEILALPRMIIESIVPPSSCNPRVRTVRFNLFSGAPLVQHSMTELTENLREAAAAPGANPSRVSGYRAAVECGDAGSRSYTAANNRLGL